MGFVSDPLGEDIFTLDVARFRFDILAITL